MGTVTVEGVGVGSGTWPVGSGGDLLGIFTGYCAFAKGMKEATLCVLWVQQGKPTHPQNDPNNK